MGLGINLHQLVNPIISQYNPNVSATLYRSTGQANVKGELKATYAEGVPVECQIQSEGTETLAHANLVGMEEVSRRCYLFSKASAADRVASIVRPISRNGDFLLMSPGEEWYSGQWFLVTAVIEDFSRAGGTGWINVRITLQVTPPDPTISPAP